MAIEQPITDYTNRDFESLLVSLLELTALKLPEYTDRSPNDLGRLLMELFAYTGDVLLYYQDRIANEAFLSTAVERRSVIDLLSLIGYTLATPAPASAELTITPPNDTPVEIEVGARFATKPLPGRPAVEFIYLPVSSDPLAPSPSPLTIPPGKVTPIAVFNASLIQGEELGVSTGEANQSFRLAQRPVLLPRDPEVQRYLRVEVGSNGSFQVWNEKQTLLNSNSGDTDFIVRVNENDEAEIIFGDGTYGQIPPFRSTIRATYLIGGGAAGNVGANTITVVKSGVSETVTVTNPQAASGGADRESIENARRQAPGVFRSLGRAVTAEDYVALAENYPGVARAIADAPSWNYVDLYVVAAGSFDLTDDLRARLLRYFESRRMVTTFVNVRDPVFVSINITVKVGVEPTFYREDVEQRTREALEALFEIDRLRFGQTFYLSKIFEAVEDVQGVAFAEVITFQGIRRIPSEPPREELVNPDVGETGVSSRISLNSGEFPRPGDITVEIEGGLPITQGGLPS